MYARTVGRKVRATAVASADELDGDVPNVGIGKALTVILVLHVLAIVAIVIGTGWGDKEPVENHSIVLDEENKSGSETGATTNMNRGTIYPDEPASYAIGGAESGDDRATGGATNERVGNGAAHDLAAEPRRRRPRVIKPRRDPNKVGTVVGAAPEVIVTPAAPGYFEYRIQSGDTFYRLGKKFKMKAQDIVDMNPNVNARNMKIGTVVRVPKK